MKVRHGVLGVLCALVSTGAVAADDAHGGRTYPDVWINPGFYSWHFDRDADLREDNWGFGAEVEFNADHVAMAGTYLNSNWARSDYVGYQWRPLHWKPGGVNVHAGVIVALIDGYPNMRDGGWYPAALPLLAIQGKRLGMNFTIVPTIDDRLYGAIALQFKLRVW